MTPTTPAPRKFGLTVGLAFVVLGTISWARGHVMPPRVLWTIGVLLVAGGLIAPAALVPVERVWLRFALVLGHINTRIILSALYYVVLTPIGLVMRLFSDPLDRSLDDRRASHWIKRPVEPVDPERYRQQF